jgi:hypothetical protein
MMVSQEDTDAMVGAVLKSAAAEGRLDEFLPRSGTDATQQGVLDDVTQRAADRLALSTTTTAREVAAGAPPPRARPRRRRRMGWMLVATALVVVLVIVGLGIARDRTDTTDARSTPPTSPSVASTVTPDVRLSCEPARGTITYSPGVSDAAAAQTATGALTLNCTDQSGQPLLGTLAIGGTVVVGLFTLAEVSAGTEIGTLDGTIDWSDSTRSEIRVAIAADGAGSPVEAQFELEVTGGDLAGSAAFGILTVGPSPFPIVSQEIATTSFTLTRPA